MSPPNPNQEPADESQPLLFHQEADETYTYSGNNEDSDESTVVSSEVSSENEPQQSQTIASFITSTNEAVSDLVEHLQDVSEMVVDRTHEVTSNIKTEMEEVRDGALEGLQEADTGELKFLEMGLTRNLSILPGELQHVADKLQDSHDEQTDDGMNKIESEDIEEQAKLVPENATDSNNLNQNQAPFSAYVGLASAVVSLSSIGPLLEFQKGTTGTMKIFWRMAGTAILLFPLAVFDARKRGWPSLSIPQWITFLLCSTSYVTMGVGFALSLRYTAVGNAVILANSQAIMLLAGNLLVGSPVTLLEGMGAIVAFAGAILCSKDSSDGSVTDNGSGIGTFTSLYGDALALLAGLGGVGYLVLAKTSRPHMGLFLFTFLTMVTGCLLTIPFQIWVLHETVTFDSNRSTGIFGFLSFDMDRLPLELIIVIVCNCMGTMGYVRAMIFFDSLVISVAGLLEPTVAEFMAFLIGVSVLPGLTGWIGNFLVAAGTLVVVWSTSDKKAVAAH